MKKIKEIINYCKTIGIVKVRTNQWGDFYSLPELPEDAWFMRVCDRGKNADIVNKIMIVEGEIDTEDTRPFHEYVNYKYHFKKLVEKAYKLELKVKQLKEKSRIEKLEKDFD